MKKIILPILILLLISCKKENDSKLSGNNINDTIAKEEITLIPFGDELISEQRFIDEIQNGKSVQSKRKTLSQIKFDYDMFNNWKDNTIEKKNISGIVLEFKKEKKDNPQNAEIFTHINLSVYNNNKKINDLIVYKQENYSEALAAINQYFYIDSSLNLWTLGVNEDEDGIEVIFWNQYKIDKESGKINLINTKEFNNSPDTKIETKGGSWEGKYFFKKTNRDELKTSFEINVKDLSNIDIVYVGDGEKPETYKNLTGVSVDDDKIKIVFNQKYGDMGIIYIEKSENGYIISGEAIANINPGNDEYPLKKVE